MAVFPWRPGYGRGHVNFLVSDETWLCTSPSHLQMDRQFLAHWLGLVCGPSSAAFSFRLFYGYYFCKNKTKQEPPEPENQRGKC